MYHDFNIRAARKYWPLQEHEARVLLLGLLDKPRRWTSHLRRYSSRLNTQLLGWLIDVP